MTDQTDRPDAAPADADGSPPGNLFVISAPSGSGKTTLCRFILQTFPDIRYSVSHTTRPPRPGEQDGVDYFFTSAEDFLDGIRKGDWAEWARVHDNYYGTSTRFLDDALQAGSDVLLDIDVQGAEQIMKQYPDAVTVFIMPPSLDVLQERLENRGTDSEDVISRRLQNAVAEMNRKGMYRHVVVNDRLEDAQQELIRIFNQYRKG